MLNGLAGQVCRTAAFQKHECEKPTTVAMRWACCWSQSHLVGLVSVVSERNDRR